MKDLFEIIPTHILIIIYKSFNNYHLLQVLSSFGPYGWKDSFLLFISLALSTNFQMGWGLDSGLAIQKQWHNCLWVVFQHKDFSRLLDILVQNLNLMFFLYYTVHFRQATEPNSWRISHSIMLIGQYSLDLNLYLIFFIHKSLFTELKVSPFPPQNNHVSNSISFYFIWPKNFY